MAFSATEIENIRAQFEKHGVETVRMYLANHRYNHDVEMLAIAWLVEEDAKAKTKREAVERERLILPRVAIGISIVALIVSLLKSCN